jgi:hypothetical protein
VLAHRDGIAPSSSEVPIGSAPISLSKSDGTLSLRAVPYIWNTHQPDKIKWILTSMSDSVLYKGCTEERKVKKAKKGQVEIHEDFSSTTFDCGNGKTRPMTWIEDLLKCIAVAQNARDDIDGDKHDLVRSRTLASALISLALEFCWTGSLQLGQQRFTAWSALRSHIQAVAAGNVRSSFATADNLTSNDVADLLVSAARSSEEGAGDSASTQSVVNAAFEEKADQIKALVSKAKLKQPVRLHALYRKILENAMDAEPPPEPVTFSVAMHFIMKFLAGPEFTTIAELLGAVGPAMHDGVVPAPSALQAAFDDPAADAAFHNMMMLRTSYVAELIKDLTSDGGPLTRADLELQRLAERFATRSYAARELYKYDSLLGSCDEAWASKWTDLLKVASTAMCSESPELLKPVVNSACKTLRDIVASSSASSAVTPASSSPPPPSTTPGQDGKSSDGVWRSVSGLYKFVSSGSSSVTPPSTVTTSAGNINIPEFEVDAATFCTPWLKHVCMLISVSLFEAAFVSTKPIADDLECDISSKSSALRYTGSGDIKLVLAGPVTLQPSNNSFCILNLKVTGLSSGDALLGLFVNGDKLLHMTSDKEHSSLCPAWLVRTVKE